jgi:hypothetical protein
MSMVSIKRALERRLSQMTPALSTAYEGADFKPVPDTAYQRVQFVPRQPQNPTFGDNYYREVGEFQVFLAYPLNKGSAEALTRAELIRDRFKRGTFMLENGIRIHVLSTPQIAGTIITQDRLVVPVIIEYTAEVNKA